MNKKLHVISFYITLVFLSAVMIFYVCQKEGWHEDEIFSYGSSNYRYDNVFRSYGEKDTVNTIIYDKIAAGNIKETLDNALYYLNNPVEFNKLYDEIEGSHSPVWKTREEALDYLKISSDDVLNFGSVYYNQLRDVHPPLFYFLVHIVSSLFFGVFSKYIIFTVSLVFFIASCFVVRKILILLNREYFTVAVLLLYGLSMGAVSTVMFQRMYMMLTFFVLCYLYLNIKIYKSSFFMNKKISVQLCSVTVLGFLTQYFFCIFAFFTAAVSVFAMIYYKKYKQMRRYLLLHVLSAAAGIMLFPASIYHIFFSYRGVPALSGSDNYLTKITEFIRMVFQSFSIPDILGLILFIVLTAALIFILLKSKQKFIILIFTVPVIGFLILSAEISPYIELRYIMCVLPVIAAACVLATDNILHIIVKNNKINTVLIICSVLCLSIYGIFACEPGFLYKGYNNYLEIAKNNSSLRFVFVGENNFNHIQSLPEYSIYEKSLILNENQLDVLTDNSELTNKDEFILSVKKYIGAEKILNSVLENTGFENYEILLDDSGDVGCIIYKIKR